MILLIGATGQAQVGAALVAQLQARKLPFRVLAHTPASFDRLTKEGIEAILADDTHPGQLAAAFQDIDRFFLLTPGSPDQPTLERRLVDAARQAGVRHVVKLSVLGAGDPDVSLLRSHSASEQLIRQSGLDYTFLRPNAFLQNLGTREVARIKQYSSFANANGDGVVSLIDTRDIAAVAATALSSDRSIGQTYELTGPEALSYTQIARTFTALLGRPITDLALSDDAYQSALLSAGLPAWRAEGLSALSRFYRAGKGAVVTDAVEQITGQPARTLDTYLADHHALFQ